MNIFALDEDPVLAAQYQIDKHVVKMVLESTQLLSTYCRITNSFESDKLYKATHINHPCSIWLRKNKANVSWLIEHAIALANEYTYRYGKIHKSLAIINLIKEGLSGYPDKKQHTAFALAMPDQYRTCDCIKAYRNYYIGEKKSIAAYTKRSAPDWML